MKNYNVMLQVTGNKNYFNKVIEAENDEDALEKAKAMGGGPDTRVFLPDNGGWVLTKKP